MNDTNPDDGQIEAIVLAAVRSDGFQRAIFAGTPRRQPDTKWIRAAIRPVEIRNARHVQFEFFDSRQSFARNEADPEAALRELFAIGFANVHVVSDGEEIEIRRSKKGKIHVARRSLAVGPVNVEHNRTKGLILPEGTADRLLVTMGIAGADGRVRANMRPKFVQINEFLKLLSHAIEPAGLLELGRPIAILDCGCGSSYLTLAVHHYLFAIRRVPATVLGVDVNDAVIRKSIEKAEAVGARELSFACGTIGAIDAKADIVLALHACDTATDDAIAQAVKSEAKLILNVPCCHKHLNRQLKPAGACEALRPILRHGILHGRTADILTDAFRALALRILGYRTDVVEFVNLEHTARNVLIRAVRSGATDEANFVNEYRELKRFWNVTPYIETALGQPFQMLVG